MAMDPTQVKPGSQVTVVTGTDFTVNAPPATTTTAPAGARTPSTTTTTTGNSGNTGNSGAFQAPTPTRRVVAALGPSFLHRQRGRRPLTLRDLTARRGRQAKISPPLVSSACPVMADERSEAR